MAVTIKDVAREAGVSVATVSRAINDQGKVAPAVRERVLAAVRELDYAPHQAARALGGRRTHTIGVVLPDLHGEFFSELIRGIGQVARASGLHLLVSSDHGDAEEQRAALRAMRGRVDGVLLMAPTDEGTRFLADHLVPSLPAVLINTADPGRRRPSVAVDGYGGARAMVRHLADAGHRRIVFVSGPADNREARERRRGYEDELAASVPGSAPSVLPGDFSEASGLLAGTRLLEGERPDAVFAANDAMAIGCLRAFADAGVDVPGEIALAGFDDIPLAQHLRPPLTTMRSDIAGLGSGALRALLGLASSDEAGASLLSLPPELIVRDSTRPRGIHAVAEAGR